VLARWTALLLACALAAGCSDGGSVEPAPPTTLAAAAGLPPPTIDALRPLIEPLVTPLGLRLTRASLVERATGRPGPEARHLALYVEPTTDWTTQRFVDTIVPLAAAVTPFVFQRWPGLDTYDICQEPPPGVDDRPEPAVVTQFETDRAYATATDWARVDLGTIVRDSMATPSVGVSLFSNRDLQPALAAAAASS
jgi:hypothetical protein